MPELMLGRKGRLIPAAKAVYYPVSFCHFELRSHLNGKHPSYKEVRKQNSRWKKLPKKESVFHDNGDKFPEEKYIDNHGREAVFKGTENGHVPMTDPEYMATYNFVPIYTRPNNKPTSIKEDAAYYGTRAGHLVLDVLPYLMTGFSNTRVQFEQ